MSKRTILRIKKHNEHRFTVSIQGDQFRTIVDTIKLNLSVRYYEKSHGWLIPNRDLYNFIQEIKSIPNVTLKIDDNVKKYYNEYLNWRKDMLKIKNGYHSVDDLRKQMKLDNRLYPFQVLGSYFLYKGKNVLLCDMVGLGKTVQSLSAVETHMNDKEINFCIIICPSTLKKNWEQEIEKWTNGRSNVIITGDSATRKKLYKQAYKYDYMIINYDLLNNDLHLIDEFILTKGYVFSLLIDEIQYIKNSKAKRSQCVKMISNYAKFSIGMSATAIENTPLDLWSIFQAVDVDIFGGQSTFWQFKNKYLKMDWFGNVIDYKNEDILKKRMNPFMLRRLKEDVLDELPDKIENNYWVDLSPIQRKFYDDVANQIITDISDPEKADKIQYAQILPMITYLRQCVLSAKLVGHPDNVSTKTDQFMDFLESIEKNSKIVLFTHFIGMVELLKETLDKYKINNICIHGNANSELYCPVDKRVSVVNEFNTNKDIKILVTSDILTEGVNITSANYLVNFDMLFNPAKMEQRIGRIDRIGQKHKVINIINFIANKTIDEVIYETVWKKRQMSTDILDNNRTENRMTVKQIKSLLEVNNLK